LDWLNRSISIRKNTIIKRNQGAYANVLLTASDLKDYKVKAKEFLFEIDFEVFEMEDVEILRKRMENFEIDSVILNLASIVESEKYPKISTLHVFDREGC
jgi:hypothetical protein